MPLIEPGEQNLLGTLGPSWLRHVDWRVLAPRVISMSPANVESLDVPADKSSGAQPQATYTETEGAG